MKTMAFIRLRAKRSTIWIMAVAVIWKFLCLSGAAAMRRCCERMDRPASFFDQMNYCLSILIHRNTLNGVHVAPLGARTRASIGGRRAVFAHIAVFSRKRSRHTRHGGQCVLK